jgi:hypothetical protein
MGTFNSHTQILSDSGLDFACYVGNKSPPPYPINQLVWNYYNTPILLWGHAAVIVAGYILSAQIPATNVGLLECLLKQGNG